MKRLLAVVSLLCLYGATLPPPVGASALRGEDPSFRTRGGGPKTSVQREFSIGPFDAKGGYRLFVTAVPLSDSASVTFKFVSRQGRSQQKHEYQFSLPKDALTMSRDLTEARLESDHIPGFGRASFRFTNASDEVKRRKHECEVDRWRSGRAKGSVRFDAGEGPFGEVRGRRARAKVMRTVFDNTCGGPGCPFEENRMLRNSTSRTSQYAFGTPDKTSMFVLLVGRKKPAYVYRWLLASGSPEHFSGAFPGAGIQGIEPLFSGSATFTPQGEGSAKDTECGREQSTRGLLSGDIVAHFDIVGDRHVFEGLEALLVDQHP